VGRLMDEDRTILQCAVFCELPRVAKALLVDHGADLIAKDERGHCALCTAAFKGHDELLTIFLTHCREKCRLRDALERPCGYLADARCYQSLLFHFPSDECMSRQEEVTVARMLVQVRVGEKRGEVEDEREGQVCLVVNARVCLSSFPPFLCSPPFHRSCFPTCCCAPYKKPLINSFHSFVLPFFPPSQPK